MSGDSAEEKSDLRVTLEFLQPAYDIRDTAQLRLSVTNTGTAPAHNLTLTTSGPLTPTWYPLPSPWTIEPDASIEATAAMDLSRLAGAGPLTITATVLADTPDADPSDNTASATATVTQQRSAYTGTVYGDANADSVRQPGEELANALVTVSGGTPAGTYRTRTDTDGHFAFQDLPVGRYEIGVEAASDGWVFRRNSIDTTADRETVMDLFGVRDLTGAFTASMRFDNNLNRAAETVPLTIRLTNLGGTPITGLHAWCESGGPEGDDLGGLGTYTGVSIAARSTAVVHARTTIHRSTEPGTNYVVSCHFGLFSGFPGVVDARAVTRVAPGYATLSGFVVVLDGYTSCYPVIFPRCGGPRARGQAGVPVYLADSTGRVVVRTVSGERGEFAFAPVIEGTYSIGVAGPWRIVTTRTDRPYPFRLRPGPDLTRVWVEPGPEQREPTPPPTRPAPPVVPPRGVQVAHPVPVTRPGDLAQTGVDPAWSVVSGLLAVLLGAFLIRRSRRPLR
ncbi:carboxypeptidase regulatory-like domain-containing protein [Actinokineospora auranticolor]|uniref:Carboxypeptidase family protein n=1 Tax=Actinokineospora auranticolor TaxID=155976 RepID=A0A2S6GLH6_9PSEU|nr:carboxypeptidase regulatory-like domain-containing protein [Actinokineospora auranticolor]PPK66088.1 carboxypeptidase family protein [Actinokineospora auranticolor]